jgi:hypothetical protein
VPRPPKPWYADGAWRTDFGYRNRPLVRGPKNAETRLQAEKELLRLREEAQILRQQPAANTPFAVVVERFLEVYTGRPAAPHLDTCPQRFSILKARMLPLA